MSRSVGSVPLAALPSPSLASPALPSPSLDSSSVQRDTTGDAVSLGSPAIGLMSLG